MARNNLARLVKILSGMDKDADEEVFQLDSPLERFAHFWMLVGRQFIRHRCLVRASALSYSTLLALIPLLAVAVGVTSSLLKDQDVQKFDAAIEKMVALIPLSGSAGTNSPAAENYFNDETGWVANFSDSISGGAAAPVVAVTTQKQIAWHIHNLVQKTNGGTLGVTGMIFLIFTAISLLRGIEETFNDIWGVTRGRSWFMQIMLYWTIITLGPLLLAAAFNQAGGAHFQSTRNLLESAPHFSLVSEHLLPMVILSLALALFYKLTPNTKVETRAALLGGFFAGTAWHVYIQISYLIAARADGASRIYGSIVLVLLLMGGLYIVWLILLFGAQIAYAFQNRAAYLQDRLADNVNQRGREFVALRIMTGLGQRFQNAQPPATVPQLSAELEVPSRLTQSVLRTLEHSGLVTEIVGADAAFMPSRPLTDINAYDILQAMRTGNGQELPQLSQPELAGIYGEFARIEQAERAAASVISLLTLVENIPPGGTLPAVGKIPSAESFLPPAFMEKILAKKNPAAKKKSAAEIFASQPSEKISPRRDPPAG